MEDKEKMTFEKWIELNKTFVNEIFVPAGMVIILVISCWIASR